MQLNKMNESPPKLAYRKTSAEIVSEAKCLLAGGGARLVQTRRPITPNVNKRQLYGREAPAPANRPPSAFSLKYLQYETRALPCLEPIRSALNNHQLTSTSDNKLLGTIQRSGSVGSIAEGSSLQKTKLPSLLIPQQIITGSLENFKESVPQRKETSFSLPSTATTSEKDHPLKRKQPQSFDDKANGNASGSQEETTIPEIKKDDHNSKKVMKDTGGTTKSRLIRSGTFDILAQSSTETLLEMLKAHAGIKECSDETLQHVNGILQELYSRVKGAKGSWRGAVLGALYGLVECNSPKILLAVARVVLALGVTGSNLTGACKLVFKVARNEVNDSLFIDSDVPELLVDGLGKASPASDGDPEACIYGYGAIRFLASANANTLNKKSKNSDNKTITVSKHKSLAYRLVKHGIIQLMILHLQILNESGSTSKLCGQPLHALYQLSGALRILSGSPIFSQVVTSRQLMLGTEASKFTTINETQEPEDIHLELAGKHLVRAAEICMDEIEVQTNIIRTLSILSDIEPCCEYMASDSARLGILFGPIGNNYGVGLPEKPLGAVSRLGYILGNIMARNDGARIQFFNNDVAMEYLLNTLEFYSNQRFDIKNNNGDTVLDVLIKLIRVIANMSVNAEVGYGLGLKAPLGVVLLNILLAANEIKSEDAVELVLATLAALHNLSYYQNALPDDHLNSHHPGSIIERMKDISLALCQILHQGPPASRAESARVLGNMTRNQVARQSFCSSNGLKILTKCLQSEDIELVATSCGVLVNLLGDWERRGPFKELKGPQLLRVVLQRAALEEDWLLCGMACQAFWNFLIDSSNVVDTLGEDEADNLAGDLAEYLDEEKIFHGNPVDAMWEQFAQVATDLLERIQSCMSISSSPCESSDDEVNMDGEGSEVNNGWNGKYKQWLRE